MSVLPDSIGVAAEEVQRLLDRADDEAALALCAELVEAHPPRIGALRLAAQTNSVLGDVDQAAAYLERAIDGNPTDSRLHHELAVIYRNAGRVSEALEAADTALAFAPNDPAVLNTLADLHFLNGQYQQAYDLLAPLADGPFAHPLVWLALARASVNVNRHEEGIAAIERCLAAEDVSAHWRTDALFRLGRIYESRGDIDKAFETYRRANESAQMNFDRSRLEREVEELTGNWTAQGLSRCSDWGSSSERPVFVAGMPRSGTSLLEQIVSSHPSVHGAGELFFIPRAVGRIIGPDKPAFSFLTDPSRLTADIVQREAERYERAIARHSVDALRVTDKLPVNFMHLGFIQVLFPRARVIHCVRNPMDTCLSCYFQNFGGANPFAYDLESLGAMYRMYRTVMDHWKSVMQPAIHDVAYEELVSDQPGESRRMIEFLGLEWDDSCLRFHESDRAVITASSDQVRRPVYQSAVGKYRKYERHLEPLSRALGD